MKIIHQNHGTILNNTYSVYIIESFGKKFYISFAHKTNQTHCEYNLKYWDYTNICWTEIISHYVSTYKIYFEERDKFFEELICLAIKIIDGD